MFSLLSQLLTVETAFSAILPSLIAHDALPLHSPSLLCPVYEGCLVATPLIAIKVHNCSLLSQLAEKVYAIVRMISIAYGFRL